ncbi:murein biosynthesis integral membrane protein MurJ [Hyphococcus flavus]|uniref:Probable lipid II flippase MurJ n=1 Tax=Hyphococcus flavus TaxID=1866326 RepID=A0AAE9ZKR1_9PROT|nr:murein biosynthesis integral membrane protein MurJ [Hyphococcus flavus]WDI32415.1 murein biosynthesis integral membrane protein MurJ [Hyphococcus flavus]
MSRNLFKSLATVSGMTMLSRVLGFVRQIFMAGIIGAGGNPVADAFWAAFRLPNMFRRLFAEGAFHAAFIPMFQGRKVDEGNEAAKAFAEEVLAGLVFLLTLLTAIVEIAAPLFVYLIASGFGDDPEKFALTTLYTRIMFPYLMMMSLVGLLSGVLNSLGRFAASAGAPLALNVCLITAILLYANADIEITGQAASWGVFAGGLVQLAILLWGAWRQGFLLKLRMPKLTPSMKRLFVLGAPGFISAGAVQINLIIGTNIASQQPGAVSWLMNADQLYQLPLAVIGIALAVVLLPLLSERVKAGDEKGAARALNRSLELSALLAIPAAAAFVVMAEPICDALFRGIAGDALSFFGVKRSAFTANDVAMTGAALAIFGCGLPAFVWHKIFLPAYFAREDTRTPMNYALISIFINTALALALFPFIGFIAVAAATVIAAWVQVILLAQKLYRQGLFSPGGRLGTRLLRILIASGGMAALVAWALPYSESLAQHIWGREWIVTVLLAGAGALTYGILAFVLGAARLADYKRPSSGE